MVATSFILRLLGCTAHNLYNLQRVMDDLGTRACSESGGEVQTLFSSFPDADALYSVLFKTEVFYYVITPPARLKIFFT